MKKGKPAPTVSFFRIQTFFHSFVQLRYALQLVKSIVAFFTTAHPKVSLQSIKGRTPFAETKSVLLAWNSRVHTI